VKKIFYFLAAISLLLFLFSTYNVYEQFNEKHINLNLHLKGFESVESDRAYVVVKTKLIKLIDNLTVVINKDQTLYFWLSLLVTGLTAGSTLVSSIQAAKSKPTSSPTSGELNRFAIIVAVLTFLSTLTNFLSTQFNERKTMATKSLAIVTQDLNDFYRKYNAAKNDEERSKVVLEYDEKIY
jgi:hypothetical protein